MASERRVLIGSVEIGGGAPVAVQSMTNTKTVEVESTVRQARELEAAGCELVRVAAPDLESVAALPKIKAEIGIPLIADVHFHSSLALAALDAGVDKLRINPGNIGSAAEVERIVLRAGEKGTPLRIGVNAGSLHRKFRSEPDLATALVKSCLEYVRFCEERDFRELVLSVKSSSVPVAIEAYQRLAKETGYPLHLGITEAGTLVGGAVKSAVGLGVLLAEGIGDTVRVSLAADPVREVEVAYEILRTLGLRSRGADVIACPTCARTEIDVVAVAEEVRTRLLARTEPITVAVMGCVVNGPGEAAEADVGIAGGNGLAILFRNGQPVGKIRATSTTELVNALMREIDQLLGPRAQTVR